jgi:hypothetical protein
LGVGILALHQKGGIDRCEVALNSSSFGDANNRVQLDGPHSYRLKKEKKMLTNRFFKLFVIVLLVAGVVLAVRDNTTRASNEASIDNAFHTPPITDYKSVDNAFRTPPMTDYKPADNAFHTPPMTDYKPVDKSFHTPPMTDYRPVDNSFHTPPMTDYKPKDNVFHTPPMTDYRP